MMDGFKRPSRPTQPELPPVQVQPQKETEDLEGITLTDIDDDASKTKVSLLSKVSRKQMYIGGGLLFLLLLLLGGFFLWHQGELRPVDSSNDSVQRVEIKEGSSLGFVAGSLQERGIIRSSLAFKILANLTGKQGDVRAGTCNLTPSLSAREVLDKITKGCHDFISVTFYPGATLETSLYAKTKAANDNKEFKDMSVRASLLAAGYSDAEITRAFTASYTSPMFADKPANEGYEGYVFGETYYVNKGASAEEVLQTAFDYMNKVIEDNKLAAKFKEQGLSVFEGITLASIVGRELDCEGKPTGERRDRCFSYQQQIAGVFFNRLESGMSLGSDVTSIYASDKLQVPSSVNIDSPYNTRKYNGLTPGPIAIPGKLALLSVASPAKTDDIYFLAGDDGLIYFAKNEAGHQGNIRNHCKLYCGDL